MLEIESYGEIQDRRGDCAIKSYEENEGVTRKPTNLLYGTALKN